MRRVIILRFAPHCALKPQCGIFAFIITFGKSITVRRWSMNVASFLTPSSTMEFPSFLFGVADDISTVTAAVIDGSYSAAQDKELRRLLKSMDAGSASLEKVAGEYRKMADNLEHLISKVRVGDRKLDPDGLFVAHLEERLQFIETVLSAQRAAKKTISLIRDDSLRAEAKKVSALVDSRLYSLYEAVETVRDLVSCRDAMTDPAVSAPTGIKWLDEVCALA